MKSYFQRGDSPTEDQFAELIDSVTNIHEDGKVTATASDGVRLFPAGKSGVAATVFTDDPDQGGSEPLWRIALDGENGLRIQDDKGKTVLTIPLGERRGGRESRLRHPEDKSRRVVARPARGRCGRTTG